MFPAQNQDMKFYLAPALGLSLAVLTTGIVSAETVWLDQLDVRAATQGWGEPHKNKSVEGHALTIGGKQFERGFGTHAESLLHINLGGGALKFTASVGVDDEVNKNPASRAAFFVIRDDKELWHSGVLRAGDEVDKNPASSVGFCVLGDHREWWPSGVLRAGDAAKPCAVDLAGVKAL